MGSFWDLGMDSWQAGSWEGEQRVSRLAGGPVLSEAQVILQEGRGAALGFQLLFRETTQGSMKVAAAEGLQTELGHQAPQFLWGAHLPQLFPGPHQVGNPGRAEGRQDPGCAG